MENTLLQEETFFTGSQEEIASDIQVPESSNTLRNKTLGKTLDRDHQGHLTSPLGMDNSSMVSETSQEEVSFRPGGKLP